MNKAKLTAAVLATAYFGWCAVHPENWHFINGVNLLIHEGGHIVFMLFGEFMYVLGGSLTQVLIPLLFVLYFLGTRQYFSAALTAFWLGESLLNVSVYAGDAVKMQLPLLFGDSSTHDWNWLLVYTGMLHHTAGVAFTIRLAGTIIILLAGALSIWLAVKPVPEENTIHE